MAKNCEQYDENKILQCWVFIIKGAYLAEMFKKITLEHF